MIGLLHYVAILYTTEKNEGKLDDSIVGIKDGSADGIKDGFFNRYKNDREEIRIMIT